MRAYQKRNKANAKTHVKGAYAMKSPPTETGLVTRTAPDGVVEYFLDGMQVTKEIAEKYEAERGAKP